MSDNHKIALIMDAPVSVDFLEAVGELFKKHEVSGVLASEERVVTESIPMLLWCPECRARHIDVGEFAQKRHHTHACQSCGHVWRPAVVATTGVRFLPGFKNEEDQR